MPLARPAPDAPVATLWVVLTAHFYGEPATRAGNPGFALGSKPVAEVYTAARAVEWLIRGLAIDSYVDHYYGDDFHFKSRDGINVKSGKSGKSMKHAFNLAIALFAVSAFAKNPPYPTLGLLHHTTEKSSLQYSCVLRGRSLECDMTQSFVRRQLEDADIPKRREALSVEMAKQSISQGDCKSTIKVGKEFEARLKDPSLIPSDQKQRFGEMTQAQKDTSLEMFRLYENVCKTNSLAAKEALREHLLNEEAGICRVGSFHWKETFRHQDTEAGPVWLSDSSPSGDCGVVKLNRFEPAKDAPVSSFWNYVARKAVSNPNGELTLLGGKCSQLDERTYTYSSNSRPLYLSCKKIEFSVL